MIAIKKVRLRFDGVMTTAETHSEDEVVNGVALPMRGCLKDTQRVLAVGPNVKDLAAGDMVKLDLSRYRRVAHEKTQMSRDERFSDLDVKDKATVVYEPKVESVGGETVLLLTERDVDFIVEEWEEAPAGGPRLTAPGPRIITV